MVLINFGVLRKHFPQRFQYDFGLMIGSSANSIVQGEFRNAFFQGSEAGKNWLGLAPKYPKGWSWRQRRHRNAKLFAAIAGWCRSRFRHQRQHHHQSFGGMPAKRGSTGRKFIMRRQGSRSCRSLLFVCECVRVFCQIRGSNLLLEFLRIEIAVIPLSRE